jgi:hypothetical protein
MGVAWSPDGHLLATYRTQQVSGERTLFSTLSVWDAANNFQLLNEYAMDVNCEYAQGCYLYWQSDDTVEVY